MVFLFLGEGGSSIDSTIIGLSRLFWVKEWKLLLVIPSLAVICGCNMKEAFVSSTTKLQASAGSFFKESSFTLGLKRFLLKTPGLYYIELNLTW
ncbi:hypothetical protein AVEN_25188-1 [Araneus ventricosus]|uniref:Uncharacterized protein n=1 Tax=Araneus ventricosus TaxID=182803 RepID=A0A4Y2RU74_ARAVE|nr:hypothetical protein AVEN_25188-1 [Araneus ventricosus]